MKCAHRVLSAGFRRRGIALAVALPAIVGALSAQQPRQRRSEASAPPAAATAFDPAKFGALKYRMIGPSRGGRVTAVTGIAGQPHTFYMGSTGGGVWRTMDAGQNWENVSDGFFAVGSMGAIDVADSDANVIYAGTGSDGLRSNVSTGRGVYKSTDGAKTWRHVGLREVGQIGAIVVHPTNPDLAYIAAIGQAFAPNAERGVYRTKDGGQSWEKVLFVSDSTGAVDLELNPANPREVYAAMWRAERKPWTIISGAREGGIYKSTDGGDNWTKLTNGLPQGLIGKIDLAVSPANPARLYALIEAPGRENGLYRSDDNGGSFTLVSTQATLLARPFYYTNVDADPKNADVVYVNNEGFFKSTDGGKTFRQLRTPHGDNHDMWINPNNPEIFVQSNDGGVNVTLNGGRTWSTQYNQPTAELYQVAVDDRFPYRVYGAQQDNSTLMVPSLPPTAGRVDDPIQQWMAVAGCETGPVIPHPTNPDVIYGGCKGQFSRFNVATGQEKHYWVGAANMYGHAARDLKYRFQRVSPIELSPHDARVIYHASQFVHRSTDEGVTWETISPDLTAKESGKQGISGEPISRDITGEEFYSTIYALRESPLERGLLWAGANDGPVHVSRDGGKSWTNVTPKDLPPGGRVQNIEPSPHRRGSAYIAAYRYLLGDWQPYIYRTEDYGKSWSRLTDGKNGIPADHPTRVVREDPSREGLLYAGTEFGMFVSFDNGRRWQSLQLNMPATPITDMRVHRKDLVLSTMGRSFWILDNVTPLHQYSDQVASAGAHLFTPREAYRLRYASFGSAPSAPQYPPMGAMIDYYFPTEPAGDITLEILGDGGKVIRTFSSATRRREAGPQRAEGAEGAEEEGMRAGRGQAPPPTLSKAAGLNRFVWDLTHEGPWENDSTRAARGGPMVAPGAYQARLIVGSNGDPRAVVGPVSFAVRMDPRVLKDGVREADVQQQVAHNLRVRDAISDARKAVAQIQAARARLSKAGEGSASADTLQKLAAIEAKLVTAPGRYPQPMLVQQLTYLYGMTSRADQKVGRDAVVRLRELRTELDRQVGELRRVLGAGVVTTTER